MKKAGRTALPACSGWWCAYFAAAAAVTKFSPFGVPNPVTLSHPGPVVSEVSVPNVRTYQRDESPLNSVLTYSVVLPRGAASASGVSKTGGLGESGEHGTGEAGSADDSDAGLSILGQHELGAGVGISQESDVRDEAPATRQAPLVGRLRPDAAGAAAGSEDKPEFERWNHGWIGSRRGNAGFVVAPASLQLQGVVRIEKQAGAADASCIGRSGGHRNRCHPERDREISVVAAGKIDGDTERGAQLVEVVLHGELGGVVGCQDNLADAVAVGDH